MEYVYAALILNETDAEINEDNLTNVLEAATVDVEESRVKALVAALEDVDITEAVEQAAAAPAPAPTGSADEGGEVEEEEEEAEEEAAEEEEEPAEEEEEDASGEGLGDLFG